MMLMKRRWVRSWSWYCGRSSLDTLGISLVLSTPFLLSLSTGSVEGSYRIARFPLPFAGPLAYPRLSLPSPLPLPFPLFSPSLIANPSSPSLSLTPRTFRMVQWLSIPHLRLPSHSSSRVSRRPHRRDRADVHVTSHRP
jgi:hypothetical protein